MAIIYSYPEIGTIAAGDLMPITDVSDSQFPTKSVTLSKLTAYFQSQQPANILNISSTTGTAGSVSLPTETLKFEGGLLINAAIDPDGGQTVKFDLDALPNPGADPDYSFPGDLLVANANGRLQFQTIAVGCQVYAMGGASKQLAMGPINLTGQAGGYLEFKGGGGTTADPLRIDTQISGVDGGEVMVKFDLVTPDAMINKLGTFVNPSSITVGKGGVIDDIIAGSADNVSGTGVFNAVAKFTTPGGGSVIGSSSIIDTGTNIGLGRNANANFAVDMGDASGQPIAIRNGLIISTNPTLPQVDNTSVIIGAGNNDIISGSDHSLTVGSGNQIQSDSDCTIASGTGNSISNSNNSIIGGSSNTVIDSNNAVVEGVSNNLVGLNNSIVLGNSNNIESNVGGGSHFVYGIGNDIKAVGTSTNPTNCFTLGSNIDITSTGGAAHRNMFSIGFDLTPLTETMTLGYDNNPATYPGQITNVRGPVKFAVNTYVNKNANTKNALLITEGDEVQNYHPMIMLPNLVDQEYADDNAAANAAIPIGGLYHTAGVVKIRLT
jgi:hypothetical protein